MLQFTRSLVAVFALTVLGSAALAQEMVDNPEYQSWARCKLGTTVTRSSEITKYGTTRKMEMVSKLVELTAERAVVKTTGKDTTDNGQGDRKPTTVTMAFPAKVKREDVKEPWALSPGKGESKAMPDEDVKVGEKTYKCKVFAFSLTDEKLGKGTVYGKSWTCQEVPGELVKCEAKASGASEMTNKMMVTAVDVK